MEIHERKVVMTVLQNNIPFIQTLGHCHTLSYGLFTLPETDSGMDSDSDSCPKQKEGVGIRVQCVVQCSHWVWNPNLSPYPSPSLSM